MKNMFLEMYILYAYDVEKAFVIMAYSYSGETHHAYSSGFVGSLTMMERTITVLVTTNHALSTLEQTRKATYQFGYFSRTDQPNKIKGNTLIPENAMFFSNKVSGSICT